MAKSGKKEVEAGKAAPRVVALAAAGIRTEPQVDEAISAVWSDLADGRAQFEQSRLLLSSIGKKLNLENLKVRAGLYKNVKAGNRFFLVE